MRPGKLVSWAWPIESFNIMLNWTSSGPHVVPSPSLPRAVTAAVGAGTKREKSPWSGLKRCIRIFKMGLGFVIFLDMFNLNSTALTKIHNSLDTTYHSCKRGTHNIIISS